MALEILQRSQSFISEFLILSLAGKGVPQAFQPKTQILLYIAKYLISKL